MGRLSQISKRSDLGYFGVSLYDPKNSFNVGGALRATGAFGGQQFVVQGKRWESKGNSWRHMDTEGAHLRIPTYLNDSHLLDYIPYSADIVAVEMSDHAESLVNFVHPKVAVYVFGPEDGAIPDEFIKAAKEQHLVRTVYIPTQYSLNLYTAVATVCYDRVAKLSRQVNKDVECPVCGNKHYRILEETFHCNACGVNWKIDATDGHEYDVGTK